MHLAIRLSREEGRDPPFDHGYLLGSIVYTRVEEVDPGLSREVHDGHGRSRHVISEIHRVRDHPAAAWFRVGTDDEDVAGAIAKALAPGTELALGETRFRVTSVEREEPVARPGEFATLSPILLIDKETSRSIVHDSPAYRDSLEAAINAQIRANTKSEGAVRVLHVEPQAVRKRTIKMRTVLAQKARLLLDGPEHELRFLVDRGIGRSPALGFGMVVGDGRAE